MRCDGSVGDRGQWVIGWGNDAKQAFERDEISIGKKMMVSEGRFYSSTKSHIHIFSSLITANFN